MKRAARISTVLGVALLSVVACFSKPDRPALDDGGTGDGKRLDASMPQEKQPDAFEPPMCGVAHDDYEMAATNPCGSWATNVQGANWIKTRSAHDVTIQIFTGQSADCATASPFKISHGTSLKIVNTNLNGTYLQMTLVGGVSPQATIYFNPGGILNLSCSGATMGIDTTTHNLPLYIRMTAATSTTSGMALVTAYYSESTPTSASSWTQFSTCTVPLPVAPDMANVAFGGSGSSTGNPSATFDEFNTFDCPPP